jgi:arylsulfatase A-like enzyme
MIRALALSLLPTVAVAQPNVLLIVGDDIGVDIVGAYGEHSTPAETPTLDALAGSGMLFRNTYAHPSCSPSRASILTGRHAFRHGVGVPANAQLSADEETLAEALSSAGYATALFGKWHLGSTSDSSPVSQGFDYFAGSLSSSVADYFAWDKTVETATSSTVTATTTYATIDTTLEAYQWIRQQSGPWFAMMAYNAPHSPMHVPPSNLLSATTAASLQGAEGDGCGRGTPDDTEDCYRAMTEAMDTAIGEMGRRLYQQGLLNDTIVIFIGDNGTPGAAVIEEGPFTADHAKTTVYDGGVRVPLIVWGAQGMLRGAETDDLVQGLDLFDTVLELTGVNGTTGTDSQSLVGYLDGTGLIPRSTLYSELFSAVQGIDEWTVRGSTHKYNHINGVEECYAITTDPGETTDLFATGGDTSTCASLAAERPCLNDPSDACP